MSWFLFVKFLNPYYFSHYKEFWYPKWGQSSIMIIWNFIIYLNSNLYNKYLGFDSFISLQTAQAGGAVALSVMLTVFCNLAAVFTVPPLVAWIIAFEDVKLDAIALLVKLVLTVLLPLLVCRCIKPGIIPTKQTVFVEFLTINLKETEQAAP